MICLPQKEEQDLVRDAKERNINLNTYLKKKVEQPERETKLNIDRVD